MLLPVRNRLAFPAGVAPGFDPRHPSVAQSAVVASYVHGIDVRTGLRMAYTGSPTEKINGGIGPSFSTGAGATCYKATSGGEAFPGNYYTIATIVRTGVGDGNWKGLVSNVTGNAGNNPQLSINFDTPNHPDVWYAGNQHPASALPLNDNTPYFIACSISAPGSNGKCFYVVTDLSTGTVRSQLVTADLTGVAASGSGGVLFANTYNHSQSFPGYLAAGMMASQYTSPQDMLAWAADPWSFWFPRSSRSFRGWTPAVGVASSSYTLVASAGIYALAGEPASYSGALAAVAGSYSLTGEPAPLAAVYAGATGSYSLTGEPAPLGPGVVATAGVYNLTGEPLTYSAALAGTCGIYTLTGEPVSSGNGGPSQVLVASPGVFTLTGKAATMGFGLVAETGLYGLGGVRIWDPEAQRLASSWTVQGEPSTRWTIKRDLN